MEDDRVSLLEQQLAQAKLIAEEADKKYEEVGHVTAKQDVSSSVCRVWQRIIDYFDEPTFFPQFHNCNEK